MKKVLIIGGSYFAGRVFAMIANQKGYELSFINRGTYSMSFLSDTVKEYKCDRRSVAGLIQLPVDGEFGPVTQGATIGFQNNHDLKIDGEVGPKTWGAALSELT